MLINKIPIILTAYMYDNLKPECPRTINKNNGTNKIMYIRVHYKLFTSYYVIIN